MVMYSLPHSDLFLEMFSPLHLTVVKTEKKNNEFENDDDQLSTNNVCR